MAEITPIDECALEQLFAEVVFDRPLEHRYTYAVPEALIPTIAVGKRVQAPFGKGNKWEIGYCVHLSHDQPTREVKSIAEVIDDEVLLTTPIMNLTRWMAEYYLCGWGQVLQAVLPAGVRHQAGLRETIMVQAVAEKDLTVPRPKLTKKQEESLTIIRGIDLPIERKKLCILAGCSTGIIQVLASKGYLRLERTRGESVAVPTAEAPPQHHLELNSDQMHVMTAIEQAIAAHTYEAILLHGVTGSGKTEIYLRAIEQVVRRGQEAIVLVPEISLTPQTIERFRGRCGSVAVLHSHMTNRERGADWRRVAAGSVQVVVGARSAVFAPTRKLGLIVIDEEHESSFKQDSTPRYHGRDVAVMRARLENIPIIMGSATPSLESWYNVHERKVYTGLSLPNRVQDRPLPRVKIIDMRQETRQSGIYSAISLPLRNAMHAALKKHGQIMLLLNRRGFSTHIHCPSCGHVAQCQHCDLATTFHRQRGILLCHYCGSEQAPYQQCPQCGKETIRFQGLGTEKLQAEIVEKFPGATLQRMDSDTMNKSVSHQEILDGFRQGHTDILLGTQMIAKGLDFPNVTLVGVINADVGLHMPDFRATERTFQLLAQVAGRTGRGDRGGQVFIQTFTPDHPCIQLAARHDYLTFARDELAQRRAHGYPPYQRLARLILRSLDETALGEYAHTLAEAFANRQRDPEHRFAPGELRVLGPAEAPVYRLNDFYRQHFQIQSANSRKLHELIRHVIDTTRIPHGVELQIDMDAYSMM